MFLSVYGCGLFACAHLPLRSRNIFILHVDPVKSVQYHCDQHVRKMLIEYAQMLSTAHRVLDGNANADRRGFYRKTHENNPHNLWVRRSSENYLYLYRMMVAALNEYDYRFGKPDKYQRIRVFLHTISVPPKNLPVRGLTKPHLGRQKLPQCIDKSSVVKSYRNFYVADKARFATWTKRKSRYGSSRVY